VAGVSTDCWICLCIYANNLPSTEFIYIGSLKLKIVDRGGFGQKLSIAGTHGTSWCLHDGVYRPADGPGLNPISVGVSGV
jgi:hypothetical protein